MNISNHASELRRRSDEARAAINAFLDDVFDPAATEPIDFARYEQLLADERAASRAYHDYLGSWAFQAEFVEHLRRRTLEPDRP